MSANNKVNKPSEPRKRQLPIKNKKIGILGKTIKDPKDVVDSSDESKEGPKDVVDAVTDSIDDESIPAPTLSYEVPHPIKSFRLMHGDELIPVKTVKYRIKSLDALKIKLSTTKSQLDKAHAQKAFSGYWREFDPFKQEKDIIVKLGNTYNVSNAWIKCYEILLYYGLLPDKLKHKDFLHFDNAAFPGSFIVSTHHLIMTKYEWNDKYQWTGSSLIESNDFTTTQLEDKYGLYANYKSKWLMNLHNNGDVLVEDNQRDFHKQIGGKVDLYTSDLGFDVSSDYNNQEMIQAAANIGQILSGLMTLRVGGGFITKQYMTFEPITLSIMYATSFFFEEFYLCKPYSSREANSETYLVGKGFKGGATFEHPYIMAMMDRISKRVPIDVPLFDAKDYPPKYLSDIIKASTNIFNAQIDKINSDLARSSKCLSNYYRGNFSHNPVVQEFRKEEEQKIASWYFYNPLHPIDNSKRLNMKDALSQA